ncbi:MAG TPA: hypothetical protein VLA00_00035 [Xanthobacteraceae bacterium]|nr:hypothetical protein [Xanthobacteraceae bacterium]
MPASARLRPRITALRLHEPRALIAARMDALRPFLARDPAVRRAMLARLLRAERRAAMSGVGYDAVRHAALRRLAVEPQTFR